MNPSDSERNASNVPSGSSCFPYQTRSKVRVSGSRRAARARSFPAELADVLPVRLPLVELEAARALEEQEHARVDRADGAPEVALLGGAASRRQWSSERLSSAGAATRRWAPSSPPSRSPAPRPAGSGSAAGARRRGAGRGARARRRTRPSPGPTAGSGARGSGRSRRATPAVATRARAAWRGSTSSRSAARASRACRARRSPWRRRAACSEAARGPSRAPRERSARRARRGGEPLAGAGSRPAGAPPRPRGGRRAPSALRASFSRAARRRSRWASRSRRALVNVSLSIRSTSSLACGSTSSVARFPSARGERRRAAPHRAGGERGCPGPCPRQRRRARRAPSGEPARGGRRAPSGRAPRRAPRAPPHRGRRGRRGGSPGRWGPFASRRRLHRRDGRLLTLEDQLDLALQVEALGCGHAGRRRGERRRAP